MREAPEKIWLQWFGVEHWGDSTWCQDETNDNDVGYVREDIADRLRGLLRRSESFLLWFIEMEDIETDHIEGLDILMEELEEELGDG